MIDPNRIATAKGMGKDLMAFLQCHGTLRWRESDGQIALDDDGKPVRGVMIERYEDWLVEAILEKAEREHGAAHRH